MGGGFVVKLTLCIFTTIYYGGRILKMASSEVIMLKVLRNAIKRKTIKEQCNGGL